MKGAPTVDGRPGENMPHIDFEQMKADLIEKHGKHIRDYDVMSAALYPSVFDQYQDFYAEYGPVEHLDTRTFFVGPSIAQEDNVSRWKSEGEVTRWQQNQSHVIEYTLR